MRATLRFELGLLSILLLAVGPGPLTAAKVAGDPLPCPDKVKETIGDLEVLIGALGLPEGLADSLLAKLRAAEATVDDSNAHAASGQLGAFQNQVLALVNAGRIDLADGDRLLQLSEEAIGTLTSCPVSVLTCRSSDAQNILFWLIPPGPHVSTRVLYRMDAFPSGPDDPDAALLGDFPGTPGSVGTALHEGLTNGMTYYYAAYADDGTGALSKGKTTWGRPDASISWSHTVGGGGTPRPIAPFAYYLMSGGGYLHALTAGVNGGFWPPNWTPPRLGLPIEGQGRRPIAAFFNSPVAGTLRMVLVASRNGRVYAVDGLTGTLLWRSSNLGSELRMPPCYRLKVQSGLTVGGTVVVGTADPTGDNKFYGLDMADGSVVWSFDNGGGANGIGPAQALCGQDATHLFFTTHQKAGGSQDTIWALDDTGPVVTKAWSKNVGDVDTSVSLSSPPVTGCAPDGCVYVGTSAGQVYSLNAMTGEAMWPSPYVTGDGPVKDFIARDFWSPLLAFTSNTKVHLLADDGTSFSLAWSDPVSLQNPSSPLVLHYIEPAGEYAPPDIRILIGDTPGRIYDLDANDSAPPTDKFLILGDPGAAKQPGPGNFDVPSRPQVGLYGTDEGVLYAFAFPFSLIADSQ